MNGLEFLKLKSYLGKKEAVAPKTYLDELAENGMLDDYLDVFFSAKIHEDPDFKERLYDSYYKYSQDTNENLEIHYLEEMCESLSFFIELTERCTNQKQ
ncbi:MAG: hypothetical protein KIT33_09760 [Candidatus Kapabacteria bacterium]|nr:hypothetical protein [Ignavibacteriota bacterium]MCW5885243.1 hypothetical protein [Candidatus Kapabacteria bacterium]